MKTTLLSDTISTAFSVAFSAPHRLPMVAALASLLLLTACGDDKPKAPAADAAQPAAATTTPAASSAATLNFGSMKDIEDINPHLYAGEMSAQAMVFEALTKNTAEGVKPWLAKSWDLSPDGRVYTFHLRDDVKFTDGTPFTAEVVKKNVDAVMSRKEEHAWMDLVNAIEKNEVVDAHTWRLTLKTAYFPTLIELGLIRPFRFVSPKCIDEQQNVVCHVATGPWILKERQINQQATFVRNDNYWGTKPKIATVVWHVVPDAQTLYLALKKGDIDLVFGADGDQLSMEAMKALEKEGHFQVLYSEPTASRAIIVNSSRPITHDAKVREALQYAVNRPAIVKDILNGQEAEAKTLFAKNVPGCDVALNEKDYDPKKAEALLDEAGWVKGADGIRTKEGQRLTLLFSFDAENAQEKTIAEAMQADLAAVGIDMTIIGEDKQVYLDRQHKGEFDLEYSLSWGAPYDPQSFLSSWREPTHGDYVAQKGLPNKAEIDKTITELLVTPDDAKRTPMVHKVLTMVHDANVYIPISFSRTKAVAAPYVKGVGFELSQYEIPFDRMSIEKK